MARPLALGARHRGGSSPLYPTFASLAQLVEHKTVNFGVGGS